MGLIDQYILGNSVLHERFRLATEILGALAGHAPQPLTIAQLAEHTGCDAKELGKLCGCLWRAMLMRPDTTMRDGWVLASPAATMTLEDVFRCVLETQARRGQSPVAAPAGADRTHHDVDLLVTQATMAINQSVFQHLRQFSLGRIKTRSSKFTALGAHRLHRPHFDDRPDRLLSA